MPSFVLVLVFGLFGVMNSVFTDGAFSDRLVCIAVIIVIYWIAGLAAGVLSP